MVLYNMIFINLVKVFFIHKFFTYIKENNLLTIKNKPINVMDGCVKNLPLTFFIIA